jgi:hypothetical protein
VDELRLAEKALTELSIQLHWRAGSASDPAVAHRLREIADVLSDEAMSLRELWASGFGEFQ